LLIGRTFIVVRRREQHLGAVRVHPSARGLAPPRRNALDIAGRAIHQIDLKKRIAGLSLALKDKLRTIFIEVSLASASPFKRQLPWAG
jgi:hypothetical protein